MYGCIFRDHVQKKRLLSCFMYTSLNSTIKSNRWQYGSTNTIDNLNEEKARMRFDTNGNFTDLA